MTALSIRYQITLAIGICALFFILYPTAFEVRSGLYDYTRWGADSFGALFGLIALVFGIGLLPISGGRMRVGLLWFATGMLLMGSAFFFGPIIGHYKLLNGDLVEALHGIGMDLGTASFLLANYWFLRIVEAQSVSRRSFLYYALIFVVLMALFYQTMFIHRTIGNSIKYWADLTSFALGGVMVSMTLSAYRRIGAGYKKVMNTLLLAAVLTMLSYPFGSIGQPNKLWTSAEGSTIHHGIMALSIICFLVTVLYLKRLEIYSPPSAASSAVQSA